MFDSFFKKNPNAAPADAGRGGAAPAGRQDRQGDDGQHASAAAKQEALSAAERLTDESAAEAFILQNGFSDARLKAAQLIHSRESLERLVQAMRNTDRRVAKLMQQRLDELTHIEQERRRAQLCLEQAQRLAEEKLLTPNQVADLDRAWLQVTARPDDIAAAFDAVRETLRARLESQATQQRAMLGLRRRQQQLGEALSASPPTIAAPELATALDELERAAQVCTGAQETASMPRALLAEFEQEQQRLRRELEVMETRQQALATRQAALAEWESQEASARNPEALRQAWAALPAAHEADRQALEDRFAALLPEEVRAAGKPAVQKATKQGAPKQDPELAKRFDDALDALEQSLQAGELHHADDHDKALRGLTGQGLRPTHAQEARLSRVRAELKRMHGWARWGGNISREELTKAAEELPSLSLPVPELAKRIGSLREHWKELDTASGPAGKEAWHRFDAACTAAYTPVAAHSKKQAEERAKHLAAAEALAVEAEHMAAELASAGEDTVDWRSIVSRRSRLQQQWKRLGPMERKPRKAVEGRFDAAMKTVGEPLAARQKNEIAEREKLIDEAAGMDPAERHAIDKLRRLQERWQERAKHLPLDRHDEQALWKRFRDACDALFAGRKAVAKSADAERRKHLHDREAHAAALEAAVSQDTNAIRTLLRDSREAWKRLGEVPRAAEQQIEARYRKAVSALQKKLDEAQRDAAAAKGKALQAKIALCRRAEAAVLAVSPAEQNDIERLHAEWEGLPAAAAAFEQALRERFDTALNAARGGSEIRTAHAAALRGNSEEARRLLLRMEIQAGLDSPAELARERLKLQVEVLQSSLKLGKRDGPGQSLSEELLQLCRLPAALDEGDAARLDRMVAKVGPAV